MSRDLEQAKELFGLLCRASAVTLIDNGKDQEFARERARILYQLQEFTKPEYKELVGEVYAATLIEYPVVLPQLFPFFAIACGYTGKIDWRTIGSLGNE